MTHPSISIRQKPKSTTLWILNLIQIGKRFHFCRRQKPTTECEPAIRMVRPDLTIRYQGRLLSVAHLQGVTVNDKVAVHPLANGLALVPLL